MASSKSSGTVRVVEEAQHMIGEIIGDVLVALLGQAFAPDTSSWSQQRRRRVGLALFAGLVVLVLGIAVAVAVVLLTS